MIDRLLQMIGWRKPTDTDPEVARALSMARNVGQRADRLNEKLQTYADSPNPFGAFAADVINRDSDQPRAR